MLIERRGSAAVKSSLSFVSPLGPVRSLKCHPGLRLHDISTSASRKDAGKETDFSVSPPLRWLGASLHVGPCELRSEESSPLLRSSGMGKTHLWLKEKCAAEEVSEDHEYGCCSYRGLLGWVSIYTPIHSWCIKFGWHAGSDIIQALMFHLAPV